MEELEFIKKEKEVLSFWQEHQIFEESIKQRRNAQPFVFYEGPPTANGLPGIHHVLARSFKDLICRYKTMQGFLVERKAGWDTHGLPVELQIEKNLACAIKRKSKNTALNNSIRSAKIRFSNRSASGRTSPNASAIGWILRTPTLPTIPDTWNRCGLF